METISTTYGDMTVRALTWYEQTVINDGLFNDAVRAVAKKRGIDLYDDSGEVDFRKIGLTAWRMLSRYIMWMTITEFPEGHPLHGIDGLSLDNVDENLVLFQTYLREHPDIGQQWEAAVESTNNDLVGEATDSTTTNGDS